MFLPLLKENRGVGLHRTAGTDLSFFFQETQDETAVLWLDEIQGGVHQSNKDTDEAQRCKPGFPLSAALLNSTTG